MPPARCDVAIQTVLGPELEAILAALRIPARSKHHDRGSLFWQGKIQSAASERPLDVIVHCQGEPGTQAASAAATKLLERFRPRFMVLSGIAAGRRGKVKIGDVAIPRAVADLTQKVAETTGMAGRPIIDRLPYSVTQLLRSFSPERAGFNHRFRLLFGPSAPPPAGQEAEYAAHVAMEPEIHEVAIASDNLLLRNATLLESLAKNVHQQIRIGEMEASGFISACESLSPPVPWLVVRGVSDFGDAVKADNFHRLASVAAATYVAVFLEHGCDVRAFSEQAPARVHAGAIALFAVGVAVITGVLLSKATGDDGERPTDGESAKPSPAPLLAANPPTAFHAAPSNVKSLAGTKLPGDPFGDAGGWSDTFKAGDPWATEVMKTLNGMNVGTAGDTGKDRQFKFRLEICPDGKLSAQQKQGTGDSTLDSHIKSTIEGLKVSVPAAVSDLLKGKCKKLQYEFTWRGQGSGRGTVR